MDALQEEWMQLEKAFFEYYDQEPEKAKQIIVNSKNDMKRRMYGRFNTEAKIFPLIKVRSSSAFYVFLGEAPGQLAGRIAQYANNTVCVQTLRAGLKTLSKSQQIMWKTLKKKQNVIDLNECLDGNLMDSRMVERTLWVANGHLLTTHEFSVLVSDAGCDRQNFVSGEFDGWRIVENLMADWLIDSYDLIICKVQNGIYMNDSLESRLVGLSKTARSKNYKFSVMKLPGSWNGNAELFVCMYRSKCLAKFNPLSSVSGSFVNQVEMILHGCIDLYKTKLSVKK